MGQVAFYCRHCKYSGLLSSPKPTRCPQCQRRQPTEDLSLTMPSEPTPMASPILEDPFDTLPVQELKAQAPRDDGSIGRGYDLREELGRGGMGAVFAARQRALDRTVAVKTVLRDGADETAISKFRAEAVVTALLEHPNIVPVHDLAAGPNGALLLVMKKAEGVTWRTILHAPANDSPNDQVRARTMTLDDHLEVLLKVCDGVAFAHARGILHCDLKPDNVMIGEYGEVLITDWGCAVAFAEQPSELVPRVEDMRTLRGTPAYMPPEIARGDLHSVSIRTDVFLLGAILYEILTGKPPHPGRALAEVIARAAHGEIETPQQCAPARELPPELCALSMLALDANPAKRPATTAEFAVRLREYRRHAEAIELAEAAKAQLTRARASPEAGDEHYRRAIAFCERAIDMWPEYVAGRNQLAEAQLDYASYALSTRSYTLAHAQAVSAATHARTSDRWDLFTKAEKLVTQARRASDVETRRRRHVETLRVGLALAAGLIIVGLVIGYATVRTQHRKLAEALAAARASESRTDLARYQAESSVRALKRLAPEFIARAQRAWNDGRYAEAAEDADAALRIDADSAGAQMLKTASLALCGERQRADEEAERYLAARPHDAAALELRKLLEGTHGEPTPELAARLRKLVERSGSSDE